MTSPDGWQDADTELYVRYADAFVPRRQEQFAVVGALLRGLSSAEVLELGCGDGRLTEAMAHRLPGARFVAVDGSDAMLERASARLTGFGERIRLVRSAIDDASWWSGPWDAVVSSLALHHLDDQGKQKLYRDLYGLLRPGGVFVQADLVRPAGADPLAEAADRWDRQVAEASERVFGGPEAAEAFRTARWNGFRFPDPVDRPSTIAEHFRWLGAAGFTEIDVCWMCAGHAVIYAKRPERG